MSSLIERNAKKNIAENEIIKKNSDYSLAVFKKIPKTVTRERKKVEYGTLLKKTLNQVLMRIKKFNVQNKFHMMLLTDNDNKKINNEKE